MKRLNARDLHHHTGAILDQVAAGDVILIEKRGIPVAELRPARLETRGFPPAHWERLRKFPKLKGDSGRYISRDRDRG